MDILKKVQKKLENFFHEKNILNINDRNKDIDNNEYFIEVFSNISIGNVLKFINDNKEKTFILNFTEKSIIDNFPVEKVINFKSKSILTLKFTLEFINLIKNMQNTDLNSEDSNNINIKSQKENLKSHKINFHILTKEINSDLLYLITIIHFVTNHEKSLIEMYSSISLKKSKFIDNNIDFEQISQSNHFNTVRYLNYLENLQNTNFRYEKVYLDSIIINGAPALSNNNDSTSTYLTINESSYYVPVLRIFREEQIIFNSNKEENLKVYHSDLNSIKFKINLLLFGDITIELLHQSLYENKKKYVKLFEIKFNTMMSDNNINLVKNNIDNINLDLRYPDDFSVGMIYDDFKKEKLNLDEVLEIKNKLNKIILMQYEKNDSITKTEINMNNNKISVDNSIKSLSLNDNIKIKENEKKELSTNHKSIDSTDTKVKNHTEEVKNEDNEDDEDLDSYLKKLEDRAK